MFIEERHKLILNALELKMRMNSKELESLVNASPATIRRDLELLEAEGRLVRVRGGAVHPGYLESEQSFSKKSSEAVDHKIAIAAAAAEMIPVGGSVFIDSGTTCLEVGRRLLARKDLTIFTNSIPLAGFAINAAAASVICIGGEVRQVSQALVGALNLSWLSHVRFDVAIIGASGLTPEDGAMTTEVTEASVKQKLFERSAEAILVADSTKWDRPTRICFGRWADFSKWIVDWAIPPSAVEIAQGRGVEVVVAPRLGTSTS